MFSIVIVMLRMFSLAYSSTPNVEAATFFHTQVDFCLTTWSHISDDDTPKDTDSYSVRYEVSAVTVYMSVLEVTSRGT
jgi:hypothetical protein